MIYFPIQRQPLQQRDIAASIKANKNGRIAFIRSFLFSFSSRLQYLVCLPLNKILKKDDLLFEAAIENHGPSSPSLSLSSSPSSSYFPVRGYHFKMLLCSVSCCSIKGAIVVDSWKRPREKKAENGARNRRRRRSDKNVNRCMAGYRYKYLTKEQGLVLTFVRLGLMLPLSRKIS